MGEAMQEDKKTILNALAVDDNVVNTMILAKMLELFNIHVDQVYHGKEALIMSGKIAYDLIFIDHIMPEMDGAQATAAIRKMPSNHRTIIIALTSDVTEKVIGLFHEAGANDICETHRAIGVVFIIKSLVPRDFDSHGYDNKKYCIGK